MAKETVFSEEARQRFWAKVSAGSSGECWPWIGSRRPTGYGKIKAAGRFWQSTHVALILDGRPQPEAPNNFALHSCNTPPCCNPAHLHWGSHQTNMDEMKSQSRGSMGSRHGMAKLTEADVLTIRASTEHYLDAAARFGVTPSMIHNIRAGRSWKHVPQN